MTAGENAVGSKWADPRLWVLLLGVVVTGASSFAVANHRINANEADIRELEKKTAVLSEINANLRFMSKALDDLNDQVQGIVDRELARVGRP
jgi:hypothetical protein